MTNQPQWGQQPGGYAAQQNKKAVLIIASVIGVILVVGIILAVVTTQSTQQAAQKQINVESGGVNVLADTFLKYGLTEKQAGIIEQSVCAAEKTKDQSIIENAPSLQSDAHITATLKDSKTNGNQGTLTYHAEGTIGSSKVSEDITVNLAKEGNNWLLCQLSQKSLPGSNLASTDSGSDTTAPYPTQ